MNKLTIAFVILAIVFAANAQTCSFPADAWKRSRDRICEQMRARLADKDRQNRRPTRIQRRACLCRDGSDIVRTVVSVNCRAHLAGMPDACGGCLSLRFLSSHCLHPRTRVIRLLHHTRHSCDRCPPPKVPNCVDIHAYERFSIENRITATNNIEAVGCRAATA